MSTTHETQAERDARQRAAARRTIAVLQARYAARVAAHDHDVV